VSRTFHGSARGADAALRDLIDRQSPGRVDGLGVTLGQLIDRWLDECARLDLSPTTLRTYRAQIERTIRPALGAIRLGRLTAKHFDDLYGSMKAAGQSPKTIRNHHAIISSALHQGVRWGWARDNMAELAKPPPGDAPTGQGALGRRGPTGGRSWRTARSTTGHPCDVGRPHRNATR
jgi:integrase